MPTEDFNFLMFLIEKTFIGKKKKRGCDAPKTLK